MQRNARNLRTCFDSSDTDDARKKYAINAKKVRDKARDATDASNATAYKHKDKGG